MRHIKLLIFFLIASIYSCSVGDSDDDFQKDPINDKSTSAVLPEVSSPATLRIIIF